MEEEEGLDEREPEKAICADRYHHLPALTQKEDKDNNESLIEEFKH